MSLAIRPASAVIVSARRGGVEIIDELADEWRDLCDVSADDHPFYRPEFIRAHIRNMIPGAKVVLVTARLDHRLQLVLPLVEELGRYGKVPLRKLRAPVDLNCGRFDAARRSGPEGDAAIRATWNYLKDNGGWDVLQLLDTPEGSTCCRLVEEARRDGFLTFQLPETWNPVVPIPADPELLQKMPLNARLRTKLRQVKREQQGSLNFYRIATADRDAIDRFFDLEASGWKGRNNTAVNCGPSTRQFFNELAESAARFGYFSLYMLELKGQLIAAHFALTYHGRCYSPVVAHNENFRQFAPGHLIVSELLEDCAARGIHTYDITGKDQEWKMKWTNDRLSIRYHFLFRGPLGQLAYAMGVRVGPTVARWLPGRKATHQSPVTSLPLDQGAQESDAGALMESLAGDVRPGKEHSLVGCYEDAVDALRPFCECTADVFLLRKNGGRARALLAR
jgi:CelD/BcsL family acetyltransferase involved in cellulose biosynthesis